jgi:hypothetical protein
MSGMIARRQARDEGMDEPSGMHWRVTYIAAWIERVGAPGVPDRSFACRKKTSSTRDVTAVPEGANQPELPAGRGTGRPLDTPPRSLSRFAFLRLQDPPIFFQIHRAKAVAFDRCFGRDGSFTFSRRHAHERDDQHARITAN